VSTHANQKDLCVRLLLPMLSCVSVIVILRKESYAHLISALSLRLLIPMACFFDDSFPEVLLAFWTEPIVDLNGRAPSLIGITQVGEAFSDGVEQTPHQQRSGCGPHDPILSIGELPFRRDLARRSPMNRTRHTPEQIIRDLRAADELLNQGQTVVDVCRTLEVSAATNSRRQKLDSGMNATEGKRPLSLRRRTASSGRGLLRKSSVYLLMHSSIWPCSGSWWWEFLRSERRCRAV
jgi:transposase-like protein